jgi:hypothetical protein
MPSGHPQRGEDLAPDAALAALLPDPDLQLVDYLVLEPTDRLGRAQRAAAKRRAAARSRAHASHDCDTGHSGSEQHVRRGSLGLKWRHGDSHVSSLTAKAHGRITRFGRCRPGGHNASWPPTESRKGAPHGQSHRNRISAGTILMVIGVIGFAISFWVVLASRRITQGPPPPSSMYN